jgi:signal transduction histidine kinase/CheY-like chemotaxis protein/putative methionine-R-sulfoxide reductase with GAF domain
MLLADLQARIAAAPPDEEGLAGLFGHAAHALAASTGAETCEIWVWRARRPNERELERIALVGPEIDASRYENFTSRLEEHFVDSPAATPFHSSVDDRCVVHLTLGMHGFVRLGRRERPFPDAALEPVRQATVALAEALEARLPRTELAELSRWLLLRNEIDRRVARAFGSVRTLEDLGRTIARMADELFAVEYSGIYFLDPDDGRLRLVHAHGLTDAEREAAEKTAAERHPGRVVRTGIAIDVADTAHDVDGPTGGAPSHGRSIRSRLYLPVHTDGRVVGTVGFASSREHGFQARHRQVLGFLCDFAGLTYGRLVAEHATERRGELLEAESAALERILGARRWLDVAHAALAIVGSAVQAGALALVELARRDDQAGLASRAECVWQPVFGLPWLHGPRVAGIDEGLRARLGRGESVELALDDGLPPAILKPVIADEFLWGVVLFEPTPGAARELDRAGRSALRTLAQAFATAIERERVTAALSQRDRLEAVGRLAAGIARDFNDLLWPIVLYSEMLHRSPALDERSREMLGDMHLSATRATELVQQVLALSQRRDRLLELVSVAEVANEVSVHLRRTATARIAVEVSIDAEVGQVLGDADLLRQALTHLVANALEAVDRTEPRSGRVRFSVDRVEREGLPWVRIQVEDNGAGLDDEARVRLFEPYAAPGPSGDGESARPLGLSVVHRAISEMEGHIAVESRVGVGTRFDVLLPLRGAPGVGAPGIEADAPEARRPATPAPDQVPSGRPASGGMPTRGRILFVDDDPVVLAVVREMLESIGYDVRPTASPVEAIACLEGAEPFVLLLTDLTMPEMTGIELARAARRLRPSLPIVCCTGFGDERTERRALEAGMTAFVRKPIDFDRFERVVADAIAAGASPTGGPSA